MLLNMHECIVKIKGFELSKVDYRLNDNKIV